MSGDQILLDRIAELEGTVSGYKKRATTKSRLQRAWKWWWRSDGRFAITLFIPLATAFVFSVFWLASGFETGHFYIDRDEHNSMWVYQTYNWGKDERATSCYRDTLAKCVAKMKEHKSSWDEYQRYQANADAPVIEEQTNE